MKKLIILLVILFGTVSAYAEYGCTDPPAPECQNTGTGQIIGTVKCPFTVSNATPPIRFTVGAGTTLETINPERLTFTITTCIPDAITSGGKVDIGCKIVKDPDQPNNKTKLTGTWDIYYNIINKTQTMLMDNAATFDNTFADVVIAKTIPVRFTLTAVDGTAQDVLSIGSSLRWTVIVTASPKF